MEVNEARLIINACQTQVELITQQTEAFAGLLSEQTSVDLQHVAKVAKIDRTYENIAGVEVPQLHALEFAPVVYPLFDTPAWVDGVVHTLRGLTEARVRLLIAKEKMDALAHELRQVSIRVNLFEKVLIPRALRNIKKIRVFLGDQELSAVGRAKVAKDKIEEKRLVDQVNEMSDAH